MMSGVLADTYVDRGRDDQAAVGRGTDAGGVVHHERGI